MRLMRSGKTRWAKNFTSPAASAPGRKTRLSATTMNCPTSPPATNLRRGGQCFLERTPVPVARRCQIRGRARTHAVQRAPLRRLARRHKILLSQSARIRGLAPAQPWFGCACCPGNLTRFPAVPAGYLYARSGDTLYVNLYADSTASVKLESGRTVKITQETRYPWNGTVK